LLSDEPVDRIAFIDQQNKISDLFVVTAALFPTTKGMKATVLQAQRSWQAGLTSYGLWGQQVQSLHGNHAADNPMFGASSDATDALLAGLAGPSLDVLDRGLAHAGGLETILIAVLCCLFGFALAATGYFRRKMVTQLLRPVINMHEGVLKLRGGDFNHRIEIASALHESHLALTWRATYDSLTGLLNRASLTDWLTATFARGPDREALQADVLFIDVDDFKKVNDTFGHEGGDALLIQIAARLTDCVRPQDIVARLGGDEFAIVVVDEGTSGAAAAHVAERILTAFRAPFTVNRASVVVSVSIGAAHRRHDTADAAELLRNADFAMYMAKGAGKDRYELFDAAARETMADHTALDAEPPPPATEGQLHLEYQPAADPHIG
jgi:diguanylate cyclase (GGDEF)-like protein